MNEAIAPTNKAIEIIRDSFLKRKARNSSYSLSAYARDLGVSLTVLSKALHGKRTVSLKLGLQISASLGLTKGEHQSLIAAILDSSPQTAKISRKLRLQLENEVKLPQEDFSFTSIEVEKFQVISQWYHMAILNLARLKDFGLTPFSIAETLKITKLEAIGALERLVMLGLLEESAGKFTRTSKSFDIRTRNSNEAVRTFHSQMITKAMDELKKTEDSAFNRRLINGLTITCSSQQIETLKDKIEKFQSELLAYLSSSTEAPDVVYQCNFQLFPLTDQLTSKE